MNVTTNQKPLAEIKGFKGLYARGAYDNCPSDHLTDCMNCVFPGPDQITIREPVTASSTIAGRTIISYFIAQIASSPRLITFNSDGNLWDETTATNIAYYASADDFVAINLFGRMYFCFKYKGKATPTPLYYYDGSHVYEAAGIAPWTAPVLAQVNPGNVGPGTYTVAYSFLYANGYISPPSPTATIVATGSNDIEISSILVGASANIIGRVILVTQANQLTLFFAPSGTIDNVITSTNINFYDSALIASADYLNDIIPIVPGGSALKFYNGRLLIIGQGNYLSGKYAPDQMLVSDVDIPDSFNAVTGVVSVPIDYGVNTSSTAVIMLGVAYVMKPNGTYAVQDNGGDPNTWSVTIIDSALGAWDDGISLFASSMSGQDTFDSCFTASQRGLMLFQQGTYQPVPFTQKIETLWDLIDTNYFYKVQIAHDVFQKRVYIAVPLTPPAAVGLPFTTYSGTGNLLVVLMMDYQEGLSPQTVKWSTWTSADFGANGILKMKFENFTLNYTSGTTPIYQLSFCIGDTTVYKIILPTTNKSQGYTTIYLGDTGGHVINQYIITSPAALAGDGIYTFTMLNLSIYGQGTIVMALFAKNRSSSVSISGFNLTNYAVGYDLQRLINFNNEKIQILIQCQQTLLTANNGFFQLAKIDLYGRRMWQMRPALVEAT